MKKEGERKKQDLDSNSRSEGKRKLEEKKKDSNSRDCSKK